MRRSVKRFRLDVAFPKSRSGALKRPIGVRGEGQPAAERPFFFSTATSKRSPSPNRHITSDLTESTTYLLSTPEKLDFVPYNGGRRGIVRLAQRVFSGNPLKSAQIRQESLFPDEAVTGVRTNRTRSARGFKMAENADGVTPFQGRAIGAPPERAPSPPPTKEKARAGKYDEIGIAHKPSTTYSTSLLLASREAAAGRPRHFFAPSEWRDTRFTSLVARASVVRRADCTLSGTTRSRLFHADRRVWRCR